jgi:hypothetical protein
MIRWKGSASNAGAACSNRDLKSSNGTAVEMSTLDMTCDDLFTAGPFTPASSIVGSFNEPYCGFHRRVRSPNLQVTE